MAKKEKKEKIIYIDDGRTIADMSGVQGPKISRDQWSTRSTAKEKWQTYWAAMKLMLRPMLVVAVGLVVIYLISLIL